MFREDLKQFIECQLNEMAKNVVKKYAGNITNRANNPFSLFDGDEEKYMAVGRSFDSQLGRRLQKIAFYCARYRYGFLNVPNIVIMRENDVRLVVEILSYPLDKGMTQHLYWSGHVVNYPSVSCKRAYVYEIKVGGNLDTKNKGENMNEVIRLEKVFSMFGNNKSKFVACYNNRGEGNSSDGIIFGMLDAEHKAIGRLFWEKILPLDEMIYDEFIVMYSEAFENNVRVRDIIANGY